MPHSGLRDILHDGGIPPATPLPSIFDGPEALRHCLTTVLPTNFCNRGRVPVAYRLLHLQCFAESGSVSRSGALHYTLGCAVLSRTCCLRQPLAVRRTRLS